MPQLIQAVFLQCVFVVSSVPVNAQQNIIFVTIDDLSRESLGIHGCTIPNITPNIDTLGASGLRFEHAHVQAANCTPSRNIMMSGLHTHLNMVSSVSGVGSGNQNISRTIPDELRKAGYHTGIMGKNSHMAPFDPYSGWDVEYDGYGSTREPENIYQKVTTAFGDAATAGKPLYFNLNIYDPHVGWFGWDNKNNVPIVDDTNPPSRIYSSSEIPYPSWFPTLTTAEQDDMMQEVTAYYNTVKRADDSVGRLLDAIEDAGQTSNTIIILMADHGVDLPGAKTMLYDHSTRSPLFVKWPGVTEGIANTINTQHMVGSTDIFPTLCDIAGAPIPAGLQGRSIVPLIKSQPVSNWPSHIYKGHTGRHHMRAVQTPGMLYIFNPWSDGSREPSTVTKSRRSWEQIKAAGEGGNAEAAAWAEHFLHRTVEELYDVTVDSDCKVNLINDPSYTTQLTLLRTQMEQTMSLMDDPDVLVAFQNRNSAAALNSFVTSQDTKEDLFKDDPTHMRDVFFDPHDDWVVFGYTIFEPFGEWGIWTPDTAGVSLNAAAGDKKKTGASAVEFDGGSADTARLKTNFSLNTANYDQLKIDLIITEENVASNAADASLSFLYNDGSGSGWQIFQTLTKANIAGSKTLTFNLPGGGLPDSMEFAIQSDFDGNTSGKIFIDVVRLTGWQDWTEKSSDDFEAGLGNWTAGGSGALHNSDSKLSGSGSVQLQENGTPGSAINLTNPIDALGSSLVKIEFQFIAENIATTDSIVLEYYTGTVWEILRSYDFDIHNTHGYVYDDSVVLNADDHTFSSDLNFRFRSLTGATDQRIFVDAVTISSRYQPSPASPPANSSYFQIETGTTSLTGLWSTVNLANNYDSAVVVCTPHLASSADPSAVVRVRNVTATSFEAKLQNPGELLSPTAATIHYVVVEEGKWTLADGRKLEASLIESDGTNGKSDWDAGHELLDFQHSYTAPVVMGQVMTSNDNEWSTFFARSINSRTDPPSGSSCYVGKHVGKEETADRLTETLGVLVIEAGSGVINGHNYETAVGADAIEGVGNTPPSSYVLSAFSTNPSVGVLSPAGFDINEGGWAVLYGATPLGTTSIALAIDEDTPVSDNERSHSGEQVAYLVFASSFDFSTHPDLDRDGIPNVWESANGMNADNPADAQLDLDGDGASALDEYRAGTSPSDASSVFRVTAITPPQLGNTLTLTWSSVVGKTYTISQSSDLDDWTSLVSDVTATSSTTSRLVSIPANNPHLFYRIEVSAP